MNQGNKFAKLYCIFASKDLGFIEVRTWTQFKYYGGKGCGHIQVVILQYVYDFFTPHYGETNK